MTKRQRTLVDALHYQRQQSTHFACITNASKKNATEVANCGTCRMIWSFQTREAGIDPAHLRTRQFYPLVRSAGLPFIRFHDLRHTAATLLFRRGVNPKVVSGCWATPIYRLRWTCTHM